MELLFAILPYIAVLAVVMLFTVPQVWGAVFTFSLLGHLSQFIQKKEKTP